jgi:DNA end-binding protein Ku
MSAIVRSAGKAARAIWKSEIRFGPITVPVKLYAAVSDRSVHFHLLHATDRVRVEQRLVNPKTGRAVEPEEAQRGYPIARDEFVVLEPDELAALAPEKSREISIVRFVPRDALAPAWYARPYHLGPDGDAGSYLALAEALAKRERIGIARWVLRGRHHVGALCARDGRLALIALRSREEVVSADELAPAEGRSPDRRELELAEQLVGALTGTFDPASFRDEYQERVRALVEAKARGRKPRLAALPRTRRSAAPLARALERSVASLKRAHARG